MPVEDQSDNGGRNAHGGADGRISPGKRHIGAQLRENKIVRVIVAVSQGRQHRYRGEVVQPVGIHFDAVQQRRIKLVNGKPDQQGQELDNDIHRQRRKPISHQLAAQKARSEEEQEGQRGAEQPPEGDVPPAGGIHDPADQYIGHEAEQEAADGVAPIPALPAKGHGMQGVAQPGVIEIRAQKHRTGPAVEKVDNAHGIDAPVPLPNGLGIADAHGQEHDEHDHAVAGPKGRIAGNVLPDHRPFTVRFP